MQLEENIALAPLTTFHLGGPARFFVTAKTVDDVRNAISFANDLPAQAGKNLPTFILGGGSNTLVGDEGFAGVVIKIEIAGIEESGTMLIAGAGENWDALVAYAVEKNLWGIENLSGIPGTVGGAVVQGIGAYGASVGQTLAWVEVFDRETEEVKKMSNAECRFDYRDSFFKHDHERHIVLRAAFELSPSPTPNVSYKDLAARFNDSSMDLKAIRDAVLDIRKGKFPDIAVEGTAGSFFKNPIMSREQADELKKRYPEMPLFAMPETDGIKVPLAWLLDKALSMHGTHVGGARLFEKQALVIAANRNASAHDVKELAALVQKKVFDELEIKIEPEVKII
jgi:UDP-N-acetylmuramate dehydrogenase